MKLIVNLKSVDKSGMYKYTFNNLSGKDISNITDDFANKEKVKVKNKTFNSSDISTVEFGLD